MKTRMQNIHAALNADGSPQGVLDSVVVQLLALLRPTDVVIGQIEPATQSMRVLAAQGAQTGDGIAVLQETASLAIIEALATQGPVVYQTPTFFFADAAPPRSVLAVPLWSNDDRCHGGLFLYFIEQPILSALETELLTTFAALAATALDNAHRKAQIQTDAISSERNRIARDLHDSVMQSIYTISLIAETLPKVWQTHTYEAQQNINALQVLAQEALCEMRALLLELRNDELTERNLGELLRQLADRVCSRSDVLVAVTIVGDSPLPKSVQLALYRIAQESLNNICKHASATRATIQLHYRPEGDVVLRVTDNGRGMVMQTPQPHQLGLGIMRERAQEIKALFVIESQPGEGTKILVTWGGRT